MRCYTSQFIYIVEWQSFTFDLYKMYHFKVDNKSDFIDLRFCNWIRDFIFCLEFSLTEPWAITCSYDRTSRMAWVHFFIFILLFGSLIPYTQTTKLNCCQFVSSFRLSCMQINRLMSIQFWLWFYLEKNAYSSVF